MGISLQTLSLFGCLDEMGMKMCKWWILACVVCLTGHLTVTCKSITNNLLDEISHLDMLLDELHSDERSKQEFEDNDDNNGEQFIVVEDPDKTKAEATEGPLLMEKDENEDEFEDYDNEEQFIVVEDPDKIENEATEG